MLSKTRNISRLWFFKYKLHHFPFWGLLFFLWAVAVYNSFGTAFDTLFLSPKGLQYLFIVVIHTLAVYFSLYVLIPRLLDKGRVFKFVVSVIAWILLVSLVLLLSYFVSSKIIGKPIDYYSYFHNGQSLVNFFTTRALPSAMGAIVLGLSIKLTKTHLRSQKRQLILEKEKLETELRFLKHQFNPHFLFNTINSIFFMIKKEPDQASDSLAKFSGLLRYLLYESNENLIPLAKELQYLENFIALEKLRKNSNFVLTSHFNYPGKESLLIAPFVLMTFIENAFKHVSTHKTGKNWIALKLGFKGENVLVFEISNSRSKAGKLSKETVEPGGIGLENVRRRLQLIYPENHSLEIEDLAEVFNVKLQLTLKVDDKDLLQNKLQNTFKKEVI